MENVADGANVLYQQLTSSSAMTASVGRRGRVGSHIRHGRGVHGGDGDHRSAPIIAATPFRVDSRLWAGLRGALLRASGRRRENGHLAGLLYHWMCFERRARTIRASAFRVRMRTMITMIAAAAMPWKSACGRIAQP